MSEQEKQAPDWPGAADVAPEGSQSPSRDLDSGRDEAGRWLPGQSGNPKGRPPGKWSFATGFDRDMKAAPTPAHKQQAAIGVGVKVEDVPDVETVGALLQWVVGMRALSGQGGDFKEIAGRLDPLPNRVDVSVGPPRRAAVPEGSVTDEERTSAESFYDDLHAED